MSSTLKIIPHLWFDNQAEEAASFYVSIFKKAHIGTISRYGKAGFDQHQRPEGSVLTVQFWINDQEFLALNGGPHFKFSEAISFVVQCETQEEIDYYWEKLSGDGDKKAQQCRWLKDKYGLSWQIVPSIIPEMLVGSPNAQSESMMTAIMKMKKLDIDELQEAYDKGDE